MQRIFLGLTNKGILFCTTADLREIIHRSKNNQDNGTFACFLKIGKNVGEIKLGLHEINKEKTVSILPYPHIVKLYGHNPTIFATTIINSMPPDIIDILSEIPELGKKDDLIVDHTFTKFPNYPGSKIANYHCKLTSKDKESEPEFKEPAKLLNQWRSYNPE